MTALAASASALGASNTALVGSVESPPLGDQHLALLGMCYGAMPLLYGLLLYQTYWYSRLHSTDTLWLKGLVYGILIFETTQSIVFLDFVYFALSLLFALPASGVRLIDHSSLTFSAEYTLASAVTGFRLDLSDLGIHGVSPNPATIGCIMLADNCLTGTLAVLMLRDRPSLKRADLFIGHLLGYYVNTGVLVSALGLLAFVFAMAHPGNFIYIGISLIAVKLYANTVLGV
ncbi:hypothetical protein VTO73DRAFT_7624 [Trametes versicolor]